MPFLFFNKKQPQLTFMPKSKNLTLIQRHLNYTHYKDLKLEITFIKKNKLKTKIYF